MQVDADDDEVWGVNMQNRIYKRPVDGSGGWKQIKGKLNHVTASGNGYTYMVSRRMVQFSSVPNLAMENGRLLVVTYFRLMADWREYTELIGATMSLHDLLMVVMAGVIFRDLN